MVKHSVHHDVEMQPSDTHCRALLSPADFAASGHAAESLQAVAVSRGAHVG